MTKGWLIAVFLFAAVVAAAWRGCEASGFAWDLANHTPTASVAVSKNLGVYVSEVDFKPAEVDLGGEHFRIAQIWIEHRTVPERINWLTTRQRIDPELILCVEVKSTSGGTRPTASRVQIKNARHGTFHFSGANDVLFTEIGRTLPHGFVLLGPGSKDEVEIELRPITIP